MKKRWSAGVNFPSTPASSSSGGKGFMRPSVNGMRVPAWKSATGSPRVRRLPRTGAARVVFARGLGELEDSESGSFSACVGGGEGRLFCDRGTLAGSGRRGSARCRDVSLVWCDRESGGRCL